jgi:hypothetical protein
MFSRLLIVIILFPCCAYAQPKTDEFLVNILSKDTNSILKEVIARKDVHRMQIIYTVIDRDKKNRPTFTNYYFNYDPELYFNPASMVKMPLAFLSLEKLNELKKYKLHRDRKIYFDSSRSWHKKLSIDTTNVYKDPTIAHFIKRAFLISENDPYNRMYQFVGQEAINRNLHQKGYRDARITRQFMGLTPDQNRITNPLYFIHKFGDTLYHQPELVNKDSFDFSKKILLGKGYWNSRDSLVNQPFDFTRHNNLSLESMQQMLQSVLFPQSVPKKQRFDHSKDDRQFLLTYLSQYPSETPWPKYDTSKFYDSYVKFFFRNSSHQMPSSVRVFNKVGWSYGFLTDVSYVADFENRIEYMLSATLYVNSDEILNDGKYEYNTMGYPFLYQLGQAIYQQELNRKRKYKPDLSDFKMKYEKRDPDDTRPSLKEVDN